ncbi:MAG: T9SS type A sorting domain-containing protein [Ignavibacteria bacterium]|nr:T9SS type A sorting domain-containing protein [Ignavibacteria bacterium]
MKKIFLIKLVLLFAVVILPLSLFSQYNSGGLPMSSMLKLNSEVQSVSMPGFDVNQMLAEDYQNASKMDVPFRYAKVFEVNYDLNNSGTWETLSDGSRVWRLEIKSENAVGISLVYSAFLMPQGGMLFVYNTDKSNLLGAFNELNNTTDKKFSTSATIGERTILEYYEPVYSKNKGKLKIAQVVHAYKDIFGYMNTEELACNININCPIGAPWVEQKRSVTRITFNQGGNGYLCTGSLVNNALQDRTLYYLTAEHCATDSYPSMQFYFNYENPTCYGTGGPTNQTLTGATLKASNYATDFQLLQLNGPLPSAYNAYFNGWDRSNSQPTGQVAIHHPGGANKKISFDYNPATTSSGFGGRLPNGFWQVFWDAGMTEGGSSGCPLYDQNKRVIGQNLGGTPSQCTNPQIVSKVFGKFSSSWDNGGSSTNQLKNWLDPNNSGIMTLDGIDAVQGSAPLSNFTSDTQSVPIGGGNINFFDLTSNGPTTWSWSFPGGTPSSSNVQNPTNISYTATGAYTVSLTTTNANGSNVKTIVNYIRVEGLPLDGFYLSEPPTLARVEVSSQDPTLFKFNWKRSQTGPTIHYIIKFKKLTTTIDYVYPSDNGGLDSNANFRKSFLDSLGNTMGYTGDSVRCTWRVGATNGVDTLHSAGTNILTIKRIPIGITQISSNIPEKFNLYNNYPNPFNPSTIIKFDVAKYQLVKIRVYNALGKEVTTLLNQSLNPGTYSVDFNGSNLASGIYFYTLESDNVMQVNKMVLVK